MLLPNASVFGEQYRTRAWLLGIPDAHVRGQGFMRPVKDAPNSDVIGTCLNLNEKIPFQRFLSVIGPELRLENTRGRVPRRAMCNASSEMVPSTAFGFV